MKHRGKILTYDTYKGCGVISTDNNLQLTFKKKDIAQEAKLLPEKEQVFFDIICSGDFQRAANVRSVKERGCGKIISFIEETGLIEDERGTIYQFTQKDIIQSIRNPQRGDAVEFRRGWEHGALKAWRVVCDNAPALQKFCPHVLSETCLEKLALLAAPENWNILNMEASKLPLLRSYLYHTFDHAMSQERIGYIHDSKQKKSHACFNTGLLTTEGEDIYGIFYRQTLLDKEDQPEPKRWGFSYFTDKWMSVILQYDRAPLAPSYYRHPDELIFNREVPIHLKKAVLGANHMHLLPASFLVYDTETLIEKVYDRVEYSLQKLRNGETKAVAKAYKDTIEFVAPLFLKSDYEADLALVLRYNEDKDYKCTVILPLDSAYKGARLLDPVTSDWLKPVCCFSELPVEKSLQFI
ncbi:MAG: DUF3825 domain-containing protein [Bacteroidia bacterium]